MGGHQHAGILNKALVKTTNSQKDTDVLGGSGGRPLTDCLQLTLLWANALGTDNKTDKFQFGSEELTLRRLRIEAFGSQNGKDLTQVKQMLLRSFGMINQVIQVNGYKRTTAVKNHVHSSLERCRCIAQAKGHHLELIGSIFV